MMPHDMDTIKGIKNLEYLSLILVLSFFFLHNIYIVGIGMIISLYAINKNSIDSYFNFNTPLIKEKRKSKTKASKSKINKIKSKKEDSLISLVETIEKIGYIPSKEKDSDNYAA